MWRPAEETRLQHRESPSAGNRIDVAVNAQVNANDNAVELPDAL